MPGKVAISGATGLVGTVLAAYMIEQGHEVSALIRKPGSQPTGTHPISWDPYSESIESDKLNGHDVVINLSGAGVADSRWTNDRMKTIRESRLATTSFLSRSLVSLENKPDAFLSASAIGYYGNRDPEEQLDETGSMGEGFLADVCRDWEESTEPAEDAGIRTVHMRTGVVLDAKGGALARMLPYFSKGFGGKFGDGKQMMSWIALGDMVRAISFIAFESSLSGPVNLVAPNPVSNAEFTKVLAAVLGRPVFAPIPAFVARLKFGRMAEETLLAGQNVVPTKLLDDGFEFDYKFLKPALEKILSSVAD